DGTARARAWEAVMRRQACAFALPSRQRRSRDLAEVFHLLECAQLPQGVFLDLPDALPRHAEDFADVLQGCRRLSVESIAELEHASLAEAQVCEGLSERA